MFLIFFLLFVSTNKSYTQSYNFLVRVPSANKEMHANQVFIDYRRSGSGQSEVRMGNGDVIYFGDITSEVCNFDPKTYPGTLIDASQNGSGQIVIKCSKSTNICFTICNMIETAESVVFQNDVFVYATSELYKGNEFEIISTEDTYQFKLNQCASVISNYPPPAMLPCNNVHTFCGDAGNVYQAGDSYLITCYPSNSLCVIANIDNNPDDICD